MSRHDGGPWRVRGSGVERWVQETDPDDEGQVEVLQRRLRREGVFRRLLALGARSGDDVEISGQVFVYVPDEDEG